jgi:hypothetical protein
MTDRRPIDQLSDDELREKLASGEVTLEELDEKLQQRMRREAASRDIDDLPDSTERDTVEGFGSGQGMGRPQNKEGRETDKPDEHGFPRTEEEEEDWPT